MMKISIKNVDKLQNRFLKDCCRLEITPSFHYLIVSISSQELYHFFNGELIENYIISSSERQPSCVQDSFGTPWGMHVIAEKIGDNEELGMVFKGRKPVGKKYWDYKNIKNERLVTTRILWLRGLEIGLNQGEGIDSYDRYIYIHGTNREYLLGSPSTLGCITLGNEEIIRLYDVVPCETLVWIEPLKSI